MAKKKSKDYTWDLNQVFNSEDPATLEEEKELIRKKSTEFISKWENRDDYIKDSDALLEFLNDYEEWHISSGLRGNYGYYLTLHSFFDENNEDIKQKDIEWNGFLSKYYNDVNNLVYKISRIEKNFQHIILQDERFKPYSYFLEVEFEKGKYKLSDDLEKFISATHPYPHDRWIGLSRKILSTTQVSFKGYKDEEKRLCNIFELEEYRSAYSKRIRNRAIKAIEEIYQKVKLVVEAEMNNILGYKSVEDDFRKVPRPDINPYFDNLKPEILDTVSHAITSRYDISHRIYSLQAKRNKVKEIKYYQLNFLYLRDYIKPISLGDALTFTLNCFKDLDKECYTIAEKFIKEKRIDTVTREGKTKRIFSIHNRIDQPLFLTINSSDSFGNIIAAAHELGHAINFGLMKKKCTSITYGSPSSLLEVSSTFFEDYVVGKYIETLPKDSEILLKTKLISLIKYGASIFRIHAYYNFEKELHQTFRKTEHISIEQINNLYLKACRSYCGESVAIDEKQAVQYEWLTTPQFRDFFYTHTYVLGYMISISLQAKLKENPEFIHEVKELISTGFSLSPEKAFAKIGIKLDDPDFWNKGLDYIESLVEEAEEIAENNKL